MLSILVYISPSSTILQYGDHLDRVRDCIQNADVSAKFLILGDYNLRCILYTLGRNVNGFSNNYG